MAALMALAYPLQSRSTESDDSLKVETKEPGQAEIMTALDALDIEMYSFDTGRLSQVNRKLAIYVDEYRKGNAKPRRLFTIECGHTQGYVRKYPEDQWADVRADHGLKADEDYYPRLKSLTLVIRRLNDSTALLMADFPGALTARRKLKLHPEGPDSAFFYSSRPFRLDPIPLSGHADMPLVLYGSGWYDERIKTVRFCGENVIDPKLDSKMVGNLPYYYVIGMEVGNNKKE